MLSERGIVIRPVGCAVQGGVRLTHAIRLTAWIREVKPLPLDFCNNVDIWLSHYHRRKRRIRLGAVA